MRRCSDISDVKLCSVFALNAMILPYKRCERENRFSHHLTLGGPKK